jgi:hypothetical protein
MNQESAQIFLWQASHFLGFVYRALLNAWLARVATGAGAEGSIQREYHNLMGITIYILILTEMTPSSNLKRDNAQQGDISLVQALRWCTTVVY